jgi:hypothetical protein
LSKTKKQKKRKALDTAVLSSEENILIKSLLENLHDIDPSKIVEQIPSPEVARVLVKQLRSEHPKTVSLLSAIGEAFGEKSVQKEIKRALFRLKQKGMVIPEAAHPEKAPSPLKRIEPAEPYVYVGPVDGSGSRVLFIALPRIPKGYDIGMGVVSDVEGLLEFISGTYSKKQMKEVKSMFFESVDPLVETTLSHAATILEGIHTQEGLDRTDAANNYLQLRPLLLEKTALLERPVIYDFIPEENISHESLTDSRIQKLLDHKLLESWIVQPEEIEPIMEEIRKTEESPILISEAQKTERIEEIKEKAVSDLYSEPKRDRLKNRLEETAYVFFKLGEEEYARLSLAAALSLDRKDSILGVNHFLKAFLDRTLDLYFKGIKGMEQPKEGTKEDSSSKLILP